MNFRRQIVFWASIFALTIVVMWLLGDVLLPFVAGATIAYLCNPLTHRLERLLPRWIAALIVITLVVLFCVLLILLIVPVIGAQLAAFIEDLPGYVRKLQALISDPSRPWLSRFVGERFAAADKSSGELMTQAATLGTAFLGKIWSGGTAVLSLFSLLVITPVVAFYFIVDWERIVKSLERLVPRSQHDTVVKLARQTDAAIAGFVRGQTVVCVLLGIFYAVALSVVGLNFGLLIGLLSGLISFIPYVGSVTGFVLATGIALAQFWPEWIWIVAVMGIFLFGQFIEGNILVPKLVGDSVGLHPLWLMFALFAFGYLFGFLGLLLAVPLAAAVGVLARFGVGRYLDSPIYKNGAR
ncbi:MAG TPA: AI-2E family transporter [Xanthobacteraceae bacterium]|nr:AI-2E family transporter [Xanthobacteraceae bacterium]